MPQDVPNSAFVQAVSEIRQRIGTQAVVTHTNNPMVQIMGMVQTTLGIKFYLPLRQTDGAELMPENRRGGDSVWCGITDDHFTWWQDRIDALS